MRLLQGSWGEILVLTIVYRSLETSKKQNERERSTSRDSKRNTHKNNIRILSTNRSSLQVRIFLDYYNILCELSLYTLEKY